MADDIQLDLDKIGYNQPTKPLQAPTAPDTANPLVSFFQGLGGFSGGIVRGAQQAAGDIGTTLGAATGMEGLNDWAKATQLDAQRSEPNLQGRPVRQAFNSVAESIGAMGAPIAATLAAGAALTPPGEALEGAGMLAASAAGAAAQAPIAFGSAKTEAIQRGADQATADRIGMESAVGQSAVFMVPMHQILQGGPIMGRILKQAAVNAGAGGALSYGQEEIMKANDVRPLPGGSEFNNTLYSTLVGGLTGAIFGAFSPSEIAPHAEQVYDTHVGPAVRAQLEAEYVKSGMSQAEAETKSLAEEERTREAGIKDMQAMLVKAQMSKNKALKDNYDIVDKEHPVVPDKIFMLDRQQGGMTTEIPYTVPDQSKETTHEASRILNAAFAEVSLDRKGDVNNVLDGIPKFKGTAFGTLPTIVQLVLKNEVGQKIEQGLKDGQDIGVLRSKLIADIKTRKLDSMDPNKHYYLGAHAGEPSETQNNFWNPVMGARKLSEAAERAVDSNGVIDPEKAQILHMGDHDGAKSTFDLFYRRVADIKADREFMAKQPKEEQPWSSEVSTTPETEGLHEETPQSEINFNVPAQPEEPVQPTEEAHETPEDKANREQLERLEAFNTIKQRAIESAKETIKEYKSLPTSDEGGLFHAILEDASGLVGEPTPEDVTAEEKPFGDESKAKDVLNTGEKTAAVMGEPLQRNYLNTISDFVKQLHNIFNIGKEATQQKFGTLKDFAINKEAPVSINVAEINSHIKTIQDELAIRKQINEHEHNAHLKPNYVADKDELERMGAPKPSMYTNRPSEELMSKLKELERAKKELQEQPVIHGASTLSKEMIEDVQKNLQNPNDTAIALKAHYDELLEEMRSQLEEEGLWQSLEDEFGQGVLDDPTGLKMMEVLKQRTDEGRPGEENDYKNEVNKQAAEGKTVKQFEPKTMVKVAATDAKTGEELGFIELDGKFIMDIKDYGDSKYVELKDGKHLLIPMKRWIDMVKESNGEFKISTIDPVQNVGDMSQLKSTGLAKVGEPIAMKATEDEKRIYNSIVNMNGWKDIKADDFGEVKGFIEANTKGIPEKAASDLANEMIRMEDEKASVMTADVVAKLSPQGGEEIKSEEISPENVRSLPLRLAFKTATMFGQRDQFLRMAKNIYGAEYNQTFAVKPPASITHEIVQNLMQDKYTMDAIRLIANDNTVRMANEQWDISAGLTKQLVGKGLVKTVNRAEIQKVAKQFGHLMSQSLEEILPDGKKSLIGTEQQFSPSGAQGTPDEWRQRDNFIKNYMMQLKFWGLPIPEQIDRRPEQAYANIIKQLTGDRGNKLLLWTKRELETPAFEAMLKAGVMDQAGIKANVAQGFSPRMHDFKGLQLLNKTERGGGGDPTTKAGVLQRDALDYDDFVERSREQGLEPITDASLAMRDYITQSLSKSMQFRTLNWLRMLKIPDTRNFKLSKSSPEIENVLKNLNYVEYNSSPNIAALSKLSGLKPNDILTQLGYFNKKDAEGLIGWNKFSFEKPFIQASLGDLLDWLYPHGPLQNEVTSKFTKITNIPKYLMVTADPLQHTFLFASSVLANAGPRLPIVLTKWALNSAKALVNMPFAALATAKGEPQERFPALLGGGPIEPGYENQENLHKFLPHGFGATMNITEGLFQDQKIAQYLIPEMMTPKQGYDSAMMSSLSAIKVTFGHFLQKELYNVTNQRYNHFRGLLNKDGTPQMTDEEAARRAVNLINSTSGVVHAANFGPTGPAYSILTFARGLTIAPLRVIAGITEPTLRKIYGNTNKFKIDPFWGSLNPITMGDLSPRDADFLQAYYAQHLAKVIALRVLAAGIVQYGLSFLDDDKKDQYGQEGHGMLNKKRFIYNNPEGFRMGVRTPWQDVNGRQVMFNPTPFREGEQLVDAAGFERYHFPESTINWMKNRLNVWEGLIYGAVNGVDLGTGQEIPGKGTDEWGNELTKWMAAKVMPLSLGVTQEEKEQRIPNPAAETANRIGSFLGTTPVTAPKGWYPGYEEAQKAEKEHQMKLLQAKEDTAIMSKQEVMNKKLTAFFTAKERMEIARGKDPQYTAAAIMKKMRQGEKLIKQEEQQQLLQTTGQTGQ